MSQRRHHPQTLSVVIAYQGEGSSTLDCLASLANQNWDGALEVILVGSSPETTRVIEKRFPEVTVVETPDLLLTPKLWALGAQRASGDVIAFTTSDFIPDERWASEQMREHQTGCAAVGGAIENALPASLVQWAVYFCRYSGFMLPFSARQVEQVAGDNASYKRWVLEEYADLVKDGFWENVVNARLCREGHALALSPQVRVEHRSSFSVRAFSEQRFHHGRMLGAQRAAAFPLAKRVAYAALSPLIPALFFRKIAGQVFEKKRNRWALAMAAPVILWFLAFWSAGEFLGYVLGYPSSGAASRDRDLALAQRTGAVGQP